MIEIFAQKLDAFLDDYCREHELERLWKKPVVRFADANAFHKFLPHVLETHMVPQDLLPEATVVLSMFFPFLEPIAKSNWEGPEGSDLWAHTYVTTNEMAVHACEFIQREVEEMGYTAAIPVTAGHFTDDVLKSQWSHRHIAWLAGQGTFGINNMLISDVGCCGRYFSVVTSLPVEPGAPLEEERCLYKRDGSCGICVQRCPVGALTYEDFDRAKCWEWLLVNQKKNKKAQVCGKCDVKLPCAHRAT